MKYNIGDKIKISGKWFDILGISNIDVIEFRECDGREKPTLDLREYQLDIIVENE